MVSWLDQTVTTGGCYRCIETGVCFFPLPGLVSLVIKYLINTPLKPRGIPPRCHPCLIPPLLTSLYVHSGPLFLANCMVHEDSCSRHRIKSAVEQLAYKRCKKCMHDLRCPRIILDVCVVPPLMCLAGRLNGFGLCRIIQRCCSLCVFYEGAG